MIRVSAKSRGLTSVADLTKAKGREADALRSVDELDLSNNAIDSLLSAFDSEQAGTDRCSAISSSALAAMSSLKHLDLHKNRLGKTSLLGLEALAAHLTHLNVADNCLESLQGLSECRQLTFLDISRNQLRHLKGLPKLVNEPGSSVGAPFTLRVSGNLCSSAAALEIELSSTIGPVLTDLDISSNRLDAVPMRLMFEHPPRALCPKLLADFPRLSRAKLDCNPFLINGAMDQCCEALLLSSVEHGAIDAETAMGLVESNACVACALLVCPSAERFIEANGRQPGQETSWRSVALKRLATIRSAVAMHEPLLKGCTAVDCDDTSDIQSASQEVRIKGEGRVSAFGAVPLMAQSTTSSAQRDVEESAVLLSRSLSASAASSRSASAALVDLTVHHQTLESMRCEHRQLKRELVDSKRIIRDQLQTIRVLQDEQQANLSLINDLQDKLKRKSTELQCTMRRAHEAEGRVIALEEKENASVARHHVSMPCDVSVNAGHNSTSASCSGVPTNVPPQQRSFHLSDEERAHIIEQRALSKLSSSFDKSGHLLSGRYAHAHRTFVYGKDLDTPMDERVRLRNIEAKHKIEHVVGRAAAQHRVRQHLDAVQQKRPAMDPRVHHDPAQSHSHASYEGPHVALDPQDEAILFLSERVAQLEAMYATQTSYCDDLSQENDDLIAKYERLIAATTVEVDH